MPLVSIAILVQAKGLPRGLSFTMRVLDPLQETFYKGKKIVDSFRVTGRLAEVALKMSLQIGMAGVQSADLPATISMRLDRLGEREVQVHPGDRDLAIRIARHVRDKLMSARLNLQSAVVSEPGTTGEHDGILDSMRDDIRGAGLVSLELKCRRLWSEAGKEAVRTALRAEEVLECKWWKQALENKPRKWRGRLILMVFVDGSNGITSRAELQPIDGDWLVLWGWRSARTAAERATGTTNRSDDRSEGRQSHTVVPARARKRDLPFPASALTYRRVGGVRVAPVGKLLEATGRPLANPGRDIAKVKRARTDLGTDTPGGKHTDELFEAPRATSQKPRGGREEWVGTERVLKIIHGHL